LRRLRAKRLIPSSARPPTKSRSTPADLAPEIVQVIAVVAEIMLEQRRRRPVEGNSVARMIPNDPAKKESFEEPPAA
jgi:hypothetical protein